MASATTEAQIHTCTVNLQTCVHFDTAYGIEDGDRKPS